MHTCAGSMLLCLNYHIATVTDPFIGPCIKVVWVFSFHCQFLVNIPVIYIFVKHERVYKISVNGQSYCSSKITVMVAKKKQCL